MLLPLLLGCSGGESTADRTQDAPPPDVKTTDLVDEDRSAGWVETQLDEMTLDEKIAHLFMIRLDGFFQNAEARGYRETVALVEEFGAGGMMFGPGQAMTQITVANELQRRAHRPLLVSQDTEWGVGMRVDDATTFPPAMALGATRDAGLAYRVGYATGVEARALGVHQIYAPVADVNNNPGNPIINVRSFGEEPALVGTMASAFAQGTQQGGALATVKHFPGHGDTDVDSHIALPVLRFDRTRLDSLELVPFRQVLDAGVASVMTGHLALPALTTDPRVPASLSPAVTTGLLRDDLGFDGLVVTDALNMDAVRETYGVGETAVRVLESGADQILMSTNPWVAHDAIRTAVDTGRIDSTQINASVRRVLRVKEELGLPGRSTVPLDTTRHQVSGRSHDVLARTVARQSLTLLSNTNDLLPLTLPDRQNTLVVTLSDSEAPGVGRPFVRTLEDQPAIDTLERRTLDPRSDSADVVDHLDAAEEADVVIVPSFLHVRAWSGSIGMSDLHRTFLDSLVANGPPAVLVAFGNPYAPSAVDPAPAAALAAYGSHAVSQRAAAQAVTGAAGTPGRLPVTVPDFADVGAGTPLDAVAPRIGHPESVGMDGRRLSRLDTLFRRVMLEEGVPGGALAVGRGGTTVALDGHGYYTYDAKTRVTPDSQYDLASLTKVVATTTAAMLLVERDSLALDAAVTNYLPQFGQNGKGAVTVRQLLTHSSGLQPYLWEDERGQTREAILDTIMAQSLRYSPGTKSEYSGLGIITLMRVVETVSGQEFDAFCEEHIFEPLGMEDTGFFPSDTTVTRAVPTTDTAGTRYQGSVHDPIARSMGGVSGNAGLFSTARDLARFGHMLVNDGRIDGRQFLEPTTIEQFTAQADVPSSARALGWDTKSDEGYSSAGEYFSPASFGHTGYTGTSFWVDPRQDLFVVLLTNRVYPDDTSQQIKDIRPRVADDVQQSIVGPPQPLLPGKPPED